MGSDLVDQIRNSKKPVPVPRSLADTIEMVTVGDSKITLEKYLDHGIIHSSYPTTVTVHAGPAGRHGGAPDAARVPATNAVLAAPIAG